MSAVIALAFVPLVVAAGLWAFQKPARVFGIYAAAIPFGSTFALPIGLPRSFTTISSILAALTVIALAWGLARRRLYNSPTLATSLWLLFLGLAAASVAWSIRPAETIDDVFVLGSLVILYLVVALYPFDRDDLAFVANGIVVGTALTGAYAIALAVTSNLPETGAGLARFEITGAGGGEGGDPNITAAALMLGFAIALHETLQPDISRIMRVGYLIATALTAIGIVLTVSRGGLLAAGIVVVVIVVKQRRGAITILILGLVMIPALFLIPDTVSERSDNTGTSGRSEIWEIALESCPQYCATGSGFATFPDVHEERLLTTPDATGTKLRFQAHSIWLGTLVELGVLGLVLLIGALVALGRDLWRVPSQARAGALAGLVGLVVTSSFLSNSTFKYFWLAIMYGTIVVNVNRMWGRKTPDGSPTGPGLPRPVGSDLDA
jgi:O-antigen ligase